VLRFSAQEQEGLWPIRSPVVVCGGRPWLPTMAPSRGADTRQRPVGAGPLRGAHRRLALAVAVVGLAAPRSAAAQGLLSDESGEECERRSCLPVDVTQFPPLCYTETVSLKGLVTQSFAVCPVQAPYCDFCRGTPPCESRCQAAPMALRKPGSACILDEQCHGQFSKCLQRVCRRALRTFQLCNADDPNDVCVLGRKACFRGHCQGLSQGDACSARPEGRDIDCNPGWYCFLNLCSPQLPAGHTCAGQHPGECVRGYRCNLALAAPLCTRQFTLDLGQKSSEATLCKSNHVHPGARACAPVPALALNQMNRPLVSGIDCTYDQQCPRADGSSGKCRCKSWWTGEGTPGYCELFVQDSSRPTFKRFWENSNRLCHQDWSPELCAAETGLKDSLLKINSEIMSKFSDPTSVEQCAVEMLSTEFAKFGVSGAKRCSESLAPSAVVAVAAAVLWVGALGASV